MTVHLGRVRIDLGTLFGAILLVVGTGAELYAHFAQDHLRPEIRAALIAIGGTISVLRGALVQWGVIPPAPPQPPRPPRPLDDNHLAAGAARLPRPVDGDADGGA